MKYAVFVYNISTLCRAISYIDTLWGKDNSTILYADLVSPIPETIRQDYKVRIINTNLLDSRCRGMALLLGSCRSSINAWKELDTLLKKSGEPYTFIVFRDNEIQEATMIEKAYRKYPQKIRIWVMEEGSGIYAMKRVSGRFLNFKRMIYLLFGVSTYSLHAVPQGMNDKVEKIICSHPELLKEKYKNKGIELEKMIPVFTQELSEYITNSVLGKQINYPKYDYVFLTQPFTDFPSEYDDLLAIHQKLLPQIFDILKKNGNTIIKLHPRESYDYSIYTGISLSKQEEKQIPFECLMQLYGNPQMISMFSSTSVTIQTEKPSIYLSKLFNIPGTDHLYAAEYYIKNNIIICDSLEQFQEALVK